MTPLFSGRNKLTNIATSTYEPPRYRVTLRDPQVHPDDERAELCAAMPSFLQGPRASTAGKDLALHTIMASPGLISNTTEGPPEPQQKCFLSAESGVSPEHRQG